MKKLSIVLILLFLLPLLSLLPYGCTKKKQLTIEEATTDQGEYSVYEVHQDRSTYGTLIIFGNSGLSRVFIVVSPNGTSSIAATRQ